MKAVVPPRIVLSLVLLALSGSALVAQQQPDRPVRLPEPALDGPRSLEAALFARHSVREFAESPLTLSQVSQLLWAAQGRNRDDGGRTAPSAGALYPLEVYVLAAQVDGLASGVYRYDPDNHELRWTVEGDRRRALATAALRQSWIADAPAVLVLAAVYGRTTQKYGEYGRTYVHMEIGHVAQNVYLQCAALGLGTSMVGAFHEDRVTRILELPLGHEPLALLPVGKPR